MRLGGLAGLLAGAVAAMLPGTAVGAPRQVPVTPAIRPSMADSFALGSGGDTLCQAQRSATDGVARGVFDRAYAVACRDAAAPVGRLYVVRTRGGDPAARLDASRADLRCTPATQAKVEDLGAVSSIDCTRPDGLTVVSLRLVRGSSFYAAEGLAAYRSALELGLRSIVGDRVVPGQITIALTGAGDAESFARVQAGSLDPDRALSEGYRRNNSGNYAEALQFFDTLLQRAGTDGGRNGEYLINRALQESDLGDFDQADALFDEAVGLPTGDPVELRLRRNYRALHLLNEGRPDEAEAVLDAPLALPPVLPVTGARIDTATAQALNSGDRLAAELGAAGSLPLSPAERATLLDAQATALRGTILRLENKPGAAEAFAAALDAIAGVRGGRVAGAARLRAEVMTAQAALAEGEGKVEAARRLLADAATLIATTYPDSLTLQAATARLAAFETRHGQGDRAIALYRGVVRALGGAGGAAGGFAGLLEPYFTVLIERLPQQPALADDLFEATQTLLRPGVAETQATLARELSGGTGEAARLFRQSLNESRQAAVARLSLAQLLALPQATPEQHAAATAAQAQLDAIAAEQSATQARLAAFPAYRAIATQALSLADFRAVLKPGEVYWKMALVGRSVFAMAITPDAVEAWRTPFDPGELARRVDAVRAKAVLTGDEGDAFDLADARALFAGLAGPAAARITGARHLIFEPDGAMLRLPVGVLIVSDPGSARYAARIARPGADAFDLTGIDWLAARTGISVALSPRAFRDVRLTPPSQAAQAYLGLGQNAPVPVYQQLVSYTPPSGAIDCRWPLTAWNHPIAATELVTAAQVIGLGHAALLTGPAFTDTAILARGDLDQYRVLHFATHGLVTAPRPECPAEPSLLTSFGGKGSDGLLSFAEIYRLHLDADLVVLSACDTAGAADVAATRAAGIETGGGNALDGLVRAFIGAGGRAVLASHWPVPDAFHATERLVEGLFTAPRGTAAADALRRSELALMAAPATSHPWFWAGFALIGDGAQPVLRER